MGGIFSPSTGSIEFGDGIGLPARRCLLFDNASLWSRSASMEGPAFRREIGYLQG